MNKLRIDLFGNPSLTIDDEPVTGFVSLKALALVYYLAATNRMHSRDALAALLWADVAEARAKKNLRDVLSNLRRLLGTHVNITRQSVKLQTGTQGDETGAIVDALLLEEMLGSLQTKATAPPARAAALVQALALLRGELLEGFYISDAPLFEEWVVGERTRYRQLHQQILSDLVDDCKQRGAHLEAIDYATRWLALDPLEEKAHRHLIALYAATGQYAAALAQYERCAEILYAELGAEPAPETTELFDRIQLVQSQPVQQLPAAEAQTPFVGRTDELGEIQRLLATDDCRLLTLTGLGGVGKTRLAHQVAHRAARQFLDGVYFVRFPSPEDADLLVTTLADAVGLRLSSDGEAEAQLIDFLRGKELLLVLDNAEVLLTAGRESAPDRSASSAPQPILILASMIRAAPALKLLVTSRERLNLRIEQIFEIPGLSVPPPAQAIEPSDEAQQELLRYDAIQLFVQCARRVWAHARPEDAAFRLDELQLIARICRLVDGMPLALELAASWVHTLSYREILHEIEQGIDLLETSMHDVPLRHRSLRAVFDHSWRLISPAQQSVLQKLSIFRGGFTRKGAQEVAGATLPILTHLVRHSFLHHARSGHYTIHNLLRQYAAEQLQKNLAEVAALQLHHSRFYAALLQAQQDALSKEQFEIFAEQLFSQMEDIRAAYNWAVTQGRLDLLAQMVESLYYLYTWRNGFVEGAERFRFGALQAAALASSATPVSSEEAAITGKLSARWGMFCQSLGQQERAHEQLKIGLAAARHCADPLETAFCLFGLAKVALGQAAYVDAEAAAQESLELYQQADRAVEQARVLHVLGVARLLRGNREAAHQSLTLALSLAQTDELRWTEADCAAALGEVDWVQGNYAGAHRHFERAATLFRLPEVTNFLGVADAFNKLGFVEWSQGSLDVAAAYHEKALQTLRRLGNRQGEGNTLSHLGRVAERQRKLDEATLLYRQALAINQETGDRHGQTISLCNLAFVAYRQGDLATAGAEFSHCRALCQQIHAPRYEAMALACLGLLDCLVGNHEQGEGVIRQSLQIAQDLQDPTILGYSLAHLGYALVGTEQWRNAALAYQAALDLRRRAADSDRLLDALSGLAYIAFQQKQIDEARHYGAELLTHLDERSLASALLPLQIHYAAYCAYRADQDPKAAEQLQLAYALLQQQAQLIDDEAGRQRFLNNPVVHQQILQAIDA